MNPSDQATRQPEPLCKHCGGPIAIRNPAGKCDHLYWPDCLTDEAKQANGFVLVEKIVVTWEKKPDEPK